MIKRKFVIILVAFLAIFTLGACSSNNDNSDGNTPSIPEVPETYYTVTFYDNDIILKQEEIKENTCVESFIPSKDNYEFKGWYTDTTYTIKFDFDTKINSNTSIYAKFDKIVPMLPLEPSYTKTDAYITEFEPSYYEVGHGDIYRIDEDINGDPLRLKVDGQNKVFEHGLYAHAYSAIAFDIDVKVNSISTTFGLSQNGGAKPLASMEFSIIIDGEYILEPYEITQNNPTGTFEINFDEGRYIKRILFVIDDMGSNAYDHGIWGDLKMNYWRKNNI